MSTIDCIKQLNKLANWYKPQRYEWVRNASLERIRDELTARRCAYHELNNDKEHYYDCVKELFVSGDITEVNPQISANDQKGTSDYDNSHIKELFKTNVYPISKSDILIQAHLNKQYGGDIDPFSLTNRHDFNIGVNEEFWLNLPISNMNDTDILSEVSRLLKVLRKPLPTLPKFKIKSQLSRLQRGGIFEYLDLSIWEQYNGYSITGAIKAIAINQHVLFTDIYSTVEEKKMLKGYDDIDISNLIRVWAEDSISMEVSDKIDLLISRQNNQIQL